MAASSNRPAHSRDGIAYGLHLVLGAFPFAFFSLALISDFTYMRTANLMWQYFSIWLITAALITGGLSVLAALVGLVTGRGGRRPGGWWHFGLTLLALLLGLVNAFVHSRDGWTAVVPEGIILSAVIVVLLIAGGAFGAVAERRG
jgi:uncharacterized membrane protein